MEEYLSVADARADPFRFAVVASRFNNKWVEGLLDAGLDALRERGADERRIQVVRVPGAFELPLAAHWLAQRKQPAVDAIIALGVLVQGETAHFEHIARECLHGLARVSRCHCLPLSVGVVTLRDRTQAEQRCLRGSAHNRGRQAALAALEMAALRISLRA